VQNGVAFVPLQLPGRENRFTEPLPTSYAELSADIFSVLERYVDLPLGVFGHCGSALAAYETVARFDEAGVAEMPQLFVSSEVAPQDGPYSPLLAMSRAELHDFLAGMLVEMGSRVHESLLDVALDILESDLAMNARYLQPSRPLVSATLTAIGWTRDDGIEPWRMTGWEQCGNTRSWTLEGDHYAFTHAPRPLLDLIGSRMFEALDGSV